MAVHEQSLHYRVVGPFINDDQRQFGDPDDALHAAKDYAKKNPRFRYVVHKILDTVIGSFLMPE